MGKFTYLEQLKEPQMVRILLPLKNNKRLGLSGRAQLATPNLIQIQFPKTELPNPDQIDILSDCLLSLNTLDSILNIHTLIQSMPNNKQLLVKAIDSKEQIEKRSSIRAPATPIKITYWDLDENKTKAKKTAEGINISTDGLLLILNDIILPYQHIGIEMTIPIPQEITISCKAQVIRTSLNSDGKIQLAVKFEDINPKHLEHILAYCYSFQNNNTSLNT